LPGGDRLATKLLAFWRTCEEQEIDVGLRENEVNMLDAEQVGGETRFTWAFCTIGNDGGRLVRRGEWPAIWPWEQIEPCATEQREEARRGSPEGMPMNGPLASAERAAEAAVIIRPAELAPF
jgi:hypothetical protein